MPGREFSQEEYRYGFNGMEKDDEFKGEGNSYDFGARMYDSRIARWYSEDPLNYLYPSQSSYSFALNTPVQALDPDGKLVIFVNGLRGVPNIFAGKDQTSLFGGIRGIYSLNGRTYSKDAGVLRNYWIDSNKNGGKTDILSLFADRIMDSNIYVTSGSTRHQSSAQTRFDDGSAKAHVFHRMVLNGEIELAQGESIKFVAHGMATTLLELGYDVEVIYDLAVHQSSDIPGVEGVRVVQ
jgi:RHS repeat-associated protein